MMLYQTERLLNICFGARSITGHDGAQLGHLLHVTAQAVACRMLEYGNASRRCQQGHRFSFLEARWTRSRDTIESGGKEAPISKAKTLPPPKMRRVGSDLNNIQAPNITGQTI